MVTLEYPVPADRADVWVGLRLGLRGALVLTAGWTTLAMLTRFPGAQAGAYAFVCAFASLWFPRLGLGALCLLLAIGAAVGSLGQGVLVMGFLALCLVLHGRKRDMQPVKRDGSYPDRLAGYLFDGSHLIALVVLTPVLVASGFAALALLLVVTMAADRAAWVQLTCVAAAVVMLPKTVGDRVVTAAGAGVLQPDRLSPRLPASGPPLDLVDMVQRLARDHWSLLPASFGSALNGALLLVGRHPVIVVEALVWLMAALVAMWLRRAVLQSRPVRVVDPVRLGSAKLVALTAGSALLLAGELIVAPAFAGAPPARGFQGFALRDWSHALAIVIPLLALELAVLRAWPGRPA